METRYEKLYKEHQFEIATAYLVTGIITSISHHFHNYTVIVFFGHLLVASSFMILISMMLRRGSMRRIASSLGIFSGATFIITFAADVIIFTVDELSYYNESKVLPTNLLDSLFITFLIAVVLWLFVLSIPLMLPAFKPRKSLRGRVPSFLFIAAVILLVADWTLKIFPLQNALIGIFVLTWAIFLGLQKNSLPRLKIILIYFSHLFFVLIPVFFLGGILSFFSKAAPTSWFWGPGIFSVCGFVISILLLDRWRRKIFGTIAKFSTRIREKLILILNKIRCAVMTYAAKAIFELSYFLEHLIGTAKRILLSAKTKIKTAIEKLKIPSRRKR